MIAEECLQRPWIEAQAVRLQVRDSMLLERCIHALDLVARLRHEGLDFVFKGGTSLILHLQPLRRLSIDVDIACTAPMEEIKRALDAVVYPRRTFTRYTHQDHRDRDEPPTKHFLIHFNSAVRPGFESHILLDVLFEPAVYPEVVEMDLATDFIQTTGRMPVRVPTVDCLLGDKLAAFAPRTIGVLQDPPPNRAGDPLEPQQTRVAKQLYDVGELFTVAHSLDTICRTYEAIRALQNEWRRKNHSMEETLCDALDAAFWLSQRDLKYGETHALSDFLHLGVSNLDSHLVGRGWSVPAAKASAGKAACLAAMLLGNAHESLPEVRLRASDASAATGELLTGRYERLRALRKLAPEAFSYWHEAAGFLR